MYLLTHEGWRVWFWPEISRLWTQSVLLDSHAQYSGVPILGNSMSTFTPWDSSSSTHAVWPKTCTHRHLVYWNLNVYSSLWIRKNHHIYLSLLLHEEVSSADEPDGGQSCTSEWGSQERGFHSSMHWREEWLHQRRQHSPECIHIVAINACLCREKEQNKGINIANKEKVRPIYIHQHHVPGEV